MDQLNAFRRVCVLHCRVFEGSLIVWQALFVPLVDKLGYEYPDGESTDTSLLRTCAITQAANAQDGGYVGFSLHIKRSDAVLCRVIKELKSRFDHFVRTGDDSRIPADLQRVIFSVVRHVAGALRGGVLMIVSRPSSTGGVRNMMRCRGSTTNPKRLLRGFPPCMCVSGNGEACWLIVGRQYCDGCDQGPEAGARDACVYHEQVAGPGHHVLFPRAGQQL